jgi:dinuclear metal center YbgI/SA1388 family protein
MQTEKIVKFCTEYLRTADFDDYCHNGLQLEGAKEVKKIVAGVSLSRELIRRAIDAGAQMLIVHHGLFGDRFGKQPEIKGVLKERLKLLLENDINLMGFHLPLDAHPEIGNNISLCRLFGVENTVKLDVGFYGNLKQAMPFADFQNLVNEKLQINSFAIAAGPKTVKTVGVISGGVSSKYALAKDAGCDAFVSGDIREHVVREVEESGINFINAGHYNTEKLGVQNLANLLAKEFGLEAEFIDVPCEV